MTAQGIGARSLDTASPTRRKDGPAAPSNPLYPAHVLQLGANREVYAQGARADRLYMVDSGTVRLCRVLPDGRRQIGAFCLPGEVFGFETGARHKLSAETVSDAVLRVFRKPLEPAAEAALLPAALEALAGAQNHLMMVGRQTAAERMASFLLDLHRRQRSVGVIDLPFSRCDISDYLCLTVETVSRCLSRMRRDRVIRMISARVIEVTAPEALRELCA